MDSANSTYDRFKIIAESSAAPCAVLKVERAPGGSCADVIIFAENDSFSMTGIPLEGESYRKFMQDEPEFDDMCYRAAFNGEKFHNYVDATGFFGGWTENMILPLKAPEGDEAGYCQFIYEISKDLVPEKYSTISPGITLATTG